MIFGPIVRGVSKEAWFLQEESLRARRRFSDSIALGQAAARSELATVWDECREPNWDRHQALPVAPATFQYASLFLDSLPPGWPTPSVGAEPDGDLTLEWHRSQRRTLSISVSANGDLHYAAILGEVRAFGTEPFLGELPEPILNLIRRVHAE